MPAKLLQYIAYTGRKRSRCGRLSFTVAPSHNKGGGTMPVGQTFSRSREEPGNCSASNPILAFPAAQYREDSFVCSPRSNMFRRAKT